MPGLPVNRIVNATLDLSPEAAQGLNFNTLLIGGDSSVISGLERYRSYDSFEGVEADFGTMAPETLCAEVYFSQVPQPSSCLIGRWLSTATAAFLNGGILSESQQTLTNFTAITNGSTKFTVDGVLKTLSSLDFSAAASLTAVAADITTALSGAATVTWSGNNFVVTSATTGTSSEIGYAQPTGSGTDISTLLQLTQVLASPTVPGYAAETPVEFVAAMVNLTNNWYGLTFASTVAITDDQYVDVSSFVEALSIPKLFGVTITTASVLDSTVTNDLASVFMAANYKRSLTQYSSTNAYAVASLFGRALTVDYTAANSVINLMFKQEPGITAETLTTDQADTLQNKRCNVFVNYANGTQLIQYGVVAGPFWIDDITGSDWFLNALQTAGFNALYTSPTKVSQTDAGQTTINNALQAVCTQAVGNGLVGPGTWNGPTIGALQNGSYLKSGFYIYASSFATQSQGDREARKAPPVTVCAKYTGAIQQFDLTLLVNR